MLPSGQVNVLTPTHLLFLGLLALIVFGPKRLPEIGRSLGKGMREFKESVSGTVDVSEAVQGVNEVRQSLTPGNIAGAVVPGVKEVRQTVSETKAAVDPLAVAPPASAEAPPVPPAS